MPGQGGALCRARGFDEGGRASAGTPDTDMWATHNPALDGPTQGHGAGHSVATVTPTRQYSPVNAEAHSTLAGNMFIMSCSPLRSNTTTISHGPDSTGTALRVLRPSSTQGEAPSPHPSAGHCAHTMGRSGRRRLREGRGEDGRLE